MIALPELLSPAGGMDQLKAAVENGADAVYMGGRLFNARQNAANFDDDEMRRAIEYAHVRGVNIYITMNTLVSDGEMQQALDAAGQVYLAGADALIVQDLGLASALHHFIPDLPLHLSTQGTVYNAEGIRALAPLGFARAILARELTISEIAETAKASPIQVEVFAHGALCLCYSGQCLMSSLIGGRSGNRGRCAQPCRLPYQLGNAKGYLLSPKDLCTIELLPELAKAGVASLKIEGRMKSPEYVAVVTGIYRRYLDRLAEGGQYHVEQDDLLELMQAFNRGGFSTGYLKGRLGRGLISRERPKHWGVLVGKALSAGKPGGAVDVQLTAPVSLGDGVEFANATMPGGIVTMINVGGRAEKSAITGRAELGSIKGEIRPGDLLYKTSDKAQLMRAAATYTGKPVRRIALHGKLTACVGQPLHFGVWDGDGHEAHAESESPAEEARTLPLSAETAREQLSKTGDMPFSFETIGVDLDGRAAARLSELNGLRRTALEQLEQARAARYPERESPAILLLPMTRPSPVQAGLSLFFWQWREEYSEVLPLADRAYVPFAAVVQGRFDGLAGQTKLMAWLPPVTNGRLDGLIAASTEKLAGLGAQGVLVGNMAHLEMLKECGLPFYGGASLNVFNGLSLQAAASLGLNGVTLSHELTMEQIAALPDAGIEKEAAVYGRLPLMFSAHCPVGAELAGQEGDKACGLCGKSGRHELIDRIGARFPVVCDPLDCRSVTLNGDRLAVPNLARRLAQAGVSMLRLLIDDESPEDVQGLAALFRATLAGESVEELRGQGYTKGHYFRGV